jgi:hypothetical protein
MLSDAFYAQPIISLGTRIVGRYLKRYVKRAVGKTKALEALAEYERELFYGNGYEVKIGKQHNCVVVERYNQLQLVVTPAEVPATVTGYKFRPATEADIASGQKLYVKEKYDRETVKQIGDPNRAASIGNIK